MQKTGVFNCFLLININLLIFIKNISEKFKVIVSPSPPFTRKFFSFN